MIGILGLGFLIGMQHALEADHIAAVSSIAARRSNFIEIVKHGLTWGLGHSITLFLFAGAALMLGRALPEGLSQPLEAAVGLMLLGLGANVLWRLWRERAHFHRHRHGDGTAHLHLHTHARDIAPHFLSPHAHRHGFRWRTLFVGLVHGMAGSAALLVLAVSQATSTGDGLLYVILFGLGSMVGMASLSSVIAVPLVVSANTVTWANRVLQLLVGGATIGIGATTVYATALMMTR